MVRIEVLDQPLAVCRLNGDAPVPSWLAGEVTAVVRRRNELSLICAADAVPDNGVEQAGPYRALAVAGTLDLDEIGILRDLAGPLADAEIPIVVVSTFDTDVVLVPEDRLEDAVTALAGADYEVTGET